jgi:hypothetical protein
MEWGDGTGRSSRINAESRREKAACVGEWRGGTRYTRCNVHSRGILLSQLENRHFTAGLHGAYTDCPYGGLVMKLVLIAFGLLATTGVVYAVCLFC